MTSLAAVRSAVFTLTKTAFRRAALRAYIDPKSEQEIIDRFAVLYYESQQFGRTWGTTYWMGFPTLKCPLDLWIYQELIHELRPDLIVETGTWQGGSAYYLASICDVVGNGCVLSIDIEQRQSLPEHARIEYIVGSSTDPGIAHGVRDRAGQAQTVLVILDSNHSQHHVLNEMRLYGPSVTPGSYMIVEDTNVNGHPVAPDHGPGPMEAIHEFLRECDLFRIDKRQEKFLMTFNPKGYLKRVR